MLAVVGHKMGLIPEAGDDGHPLGVARQQNIGRDVTLLNFQMILQRHWFSSLKLMLFQAVSRPFCTSGGAARRTVVPLL